MSGQNRSFGVAIFGLGRAGTIHFKNVIQRPRLRIAYLVDIFPENCRKLLEKHYVPTDTTQVCSADDCQKVFEDDKVQFVIVTTPTDQHEAIVRRALEAGKAVFCEKPVAASRETTDDLFVLAESRKIPLYCAFQRRFDPSFARLRAQVREGDIGNLHMITTFSRDSPLPSMAYLKVSKGIFHDCAVHDIDMVCWVANEAPDSVFVRATARHPEIKEMGDVDTVAISLSFPSGLLATIHLSRHSSYHYDQRLEAHGDQGMLQCGNVPGDIVQHFSANGALSALPHFSFPQRYVEAYAIELDHFVGVLSGETERLLVSREDVRLVSDIAVACERSLHTNLPVKLPLEN